MADAPDITQQLLAMQSLINSSGGGGKRAYLFGLIPLDMDVTGPFAMQSAAPLSKSIAAMFSGTGKSGGIGDKILQALASIPEDLRKRAQEAGVMYSGDMPNGSVHHNEGGFSSMVSGGPSDIQIT